MSRITFPCSNIDDTKQCIPAGLKKYPCVFVHTENLEYRERGSFSENLFLHLGNKQDSTNGKLLFVSIRKWYPFTVAPVRSHVIGLDYPGND